ncbi:type IV pilus modification protein PilV [Endozoicomonas lisbonensis]|uniref:Type IV pilus assembly protein PilV n=1 Tax=Endozoicomonas lisbonensis TaxID=3120522 RepID=A0ABV2SCQ2_9GAMM
MKQFIEPQKNTRQQGFGLIEVLISLLIFALGILGIAGMQGQALRVTQDSLQRSQAVWLAYDLAERMWANPEGLEAGNLYQTTATSAAVAGYCAGTPPTSCIGSTCTSNQMVEYDIFDLICNNPGIVNPQLALTCAATPCIDGAVTIDVSWDARGDVGGVFSGRRNLSITVRQ